MPTTTLPVVSPVDAHINHDNLQHFFETVIPDTTFQPASFIVDEECLPSGMNWAALFCAMSVNTKGFTDLNSCITLNNPCGLITGGSLQKFQTVREGVRAGVKYLLDNKVTDFAATLHGPDILKLYDNLLTYCVEDNPDPAPIIITPPAPPPLPPVVKPPQPPATTKGIAHDVAVVLVYLYSLNSILQWFIPGLWENIFKAFLDLIKMIVGSP